MTCYRPIPATLAAVLTCLVVQCAPAAATPSVVSLLPVDRFVRVWDDRGSGADDDVSIWRPDVARYPGYRSLGDIAMAGYGQPAHAFLVRDEHGLLARPRGYRWIWDDRGSGGDRDVTLWEPVPPDGFTCLGTVASPGYDRPPSTDIVRCLKTDHTLAGTAEEVWDDGGSGADDDVSLWQSNPTDHRGLPASTFVARQSHDDNGGSWRYRVIDKSLTDARALSGAPITIETARAFAPRVWLHPDETYFPSTVEFHLAHVHEEGDHLVTREPLGCPSCTDPAFLDGQRVDTEAVSAYAEVVPRVTQGEPSNVTDIIYWMFYPYNQGKRVCVGVMLPFGCVGGYGTFGNHVGDWEHVTIRFIDNLPAGIYFSQHAGGQEFVYGDKRVSLGGWRPDVYAAKGSHGAYPATGVHVYRWLPNGDNLNDQTGAGPLWDTAEALIAFSWQPTGSYSGDLEWLNITKRWGNPKAGCEVIEPIAGECVRNDGPVGPMLKNYSQPPLAPLE